MLAIDGYGSRIAKELRAILDEKGSAMADYQGRPTPEPVADMRKVAGIAPDGFDRFLFCAGFMAGKKVDNLTQEEAWSTWAVNFFQVVAACERILARNDAARICVVGSESGITGSFDRAYAGAKAALHNYVENRRVSPKQQIVCVAPTIVSDAGMTTRRTDQDELAERAKAHPKGRWLTAREVARMVHFLLYVDEGYTSGCVIRMNGGGHIK